MRSLKPYGSAATLIECPDGADARALAQSLRRWHPELAHLLTVGANTVLVNSIIDADLAQKLLAAETFGADAQVTQPHEIEVIYDGEDLAEVAETLGLSVAAVIDAHTTRPWTVAFMGFAPGFGYLERGDDPLVIPRRETPRAKVPAGSVALAGRWSGVYPRSAPGGWQLIGCTNAPLFDLGRADPALLQPGYLVSFLPVREFVEVSAPAPSEAKPAKRPQASLAHAEGSLTGPPPAAPTHSNGSFSTPPPPSLAHAEDSLTGPPPAAPTHSNAPVAGGPLTSSTHSDDSLAGPAAASPTHMPGPLPGLAPAPLAKPNSPRPTPTRVPPAAPANATTPAETPALTVLSPGPLCLIEDLGRPHLTGLGVSTSGAADRSALVAANRAVGNADDTAGLEITDGGFAAQAETDLLIAVTAGELLVNGVVDHRPNPVLVKAGDLIEVRAGTRGWRSYLAVRGGVAGGLVLGSRSSDVLSGLGPSPVSAGDQIFQASETGLIRLDRDPPTPRISWAVPLSFGPQFDWLPEESWRQFLATDWVVSQQSNRIGTRLTGPQISYHLDSELPSQGIVRGAVQLPPSGQPIIFGPDHPVTGGYPVIAVVEPDSLDLPAQWRPGDRIQLTLSS